MLKANNINEIKKIIFDNSKNYTNHTLLNQYYKIFAVRRLTEFILVVILQYSSLSIGQLKDITTLVSPALGVAVAILFLRGYRSSPGIFVGTLLAGVNSGLSLQLSVFVGCLILVHSIFIRYIALKFVGPIIPLNNLKVWFNFLLLIAITSIISSLILYFGLQVYYSFEFNFIILTKSLLGNILGGIIFTPIALICDNTISNNKPNRTKPLWSYILIYGLLALINLITCYALSSNAMFLSIISTLPLTVIATVKFKQYGPLISGVISGIILTMGQDVGNITILLKQNPTDQIIIQLKLIIEIILFFSIATLWEQKRIVD